MKRFGCLLAMVVLALSSAAALRGQTYEVFHQFGPDGPIGPNDLIRDPDGNFYGTSVVGGTTNDGTVFRMDGGGVVTTLYEFTGGADGQLPSTGLLRASNGDLYGTTEYAGSATCHCGTIFRIDSNGIFTTVHTFEGTDGGNPNTDLVEPQPGDIWGATRYGGDLTCSAPNGCGTIFRMHLNGDLETMHAFSGTDGHYPESKLLLADDGNLYGTTLAGGTADAGTAFRITLNGNLTVIHDFAGFFRPGTLIQASSGDLVGTAIRSAGTDNGGVYRLTLDGDFEILHEFAADGHEGKLPYAPVFQADDGFLYGTTSAGGTNGWGTVFQLGENGSFTTIHNFDLTQGVSPVDGLIQASDGRLYGTTPFGGANAGAGVVYRITMPGSLHYYCPTDFVRRDQMAVFLLKIEHGAAYVPPDCANQFPDVACPSLFANWIEQLAAEGVTAGCGSGNYWPLSPVTRAQMAVFLLKTEHGAAYSPPDCAGIFPDVLCPSTFAAWIEKLAAEGITAGCAGGNFCPDSAVTREQMAVFLLKLEHGSAFTPPACQYVFTDVACPSLFVNWVEALYGEKITAGCAGPRDASHVPGRPLALTLPPAGGEGKLARSNPVESSVPCATSPCGPVSIPFSRRWRSRAATSVWRGTSRARISPRRRPRWRSPSPTPTRSG